jgi:hypothetical protein
MSGTPLFQQQSVPSKSGAFAALASRTHGMSPQQKMAAIRSTVPKSRARGGKKISKKAKKSKKSKKVGKKSKKSKKVGKKSKKSKKVGKKSKKSKK